MNDKIDDGGFAFPVGFHPDGNSADQQGMTLRDWFATHAPESERENFYNPKLLGDNIAWRWRYADAMLKARKK